MVHQWPAADCGKRLRLLAEPGGEWTKTSYDVGERGTTASRSLHRQDADGGRLMNDRAWAAPRYERRQNLFCRVRHGSPDVGCASAHRLPSGSETVVR